MDIPPSPLTPFGDENFHPRFIKINHPLFCLIFGLLLSTRYQVHILFSLLGLSIFKLNHGSHRHFNDQVLAFQSGHFFACSSLTVVRKKFLTVGKRLQSIQIGVGFHINVSPFTTITTIRATLGDKSFATETDTAIAPISRSYPYFYLINHAYILPFIHPNEVSHLVDAEALAI